MDKFLYFCCPPNQKKKKVFLLCMLQSFSWGLEYLLIVIHQVIMCIPFHSTYFFVNIGDINQVSAGNELGPPWMAKLNKQLQGQCMGVNINIIYCHLLKSIHVRECNIHLRKERHDSVNTGRKRKIVKTKPCTMTKACHL